MDVVLLDVSVVDGEVVDVEVVDVEVVDVEVVDACGAVAVVDVVDVVDVGRFDVVVDRARVGGAVVGAGRLDVVAGVGVMGVGRLAGMDVVGADRLDGGGAEASLSCVVAPVAVSATQTMAPTPTSAARPRRGELVPRRMDPRGYL